MHRSSAWILAFVLAFGQYVCAKDAKNVGALKEICNEKGSQFLDGYDNEDYTWPDGKSRNGVFVDVLNEGAQKGEVFSDLLVRAAEEIWKPYANSPVCKGIPDGDYQMRYDVKTPDNDNDAMLLTVKVKDGKPSEKVVKGKPEDDAIKDFDNLISKEKKKNKNYNYKLDGYQIYLRFLDQDNEGYPDA